jgi:hypothetical protein
MGTHVLMAGLSKRELIKLFHNYRRKYLKNKIELGMWSSSWLMPCKALMDTFEGGGQLDKVNVWWQFVA